jgi:hypothetical protein
VYPPVDLDGDPAAGAVDFDREADRVYGPNYV